MSAPDAGQTSQSNVCPELVRADTTFDTAPCLPQGQTLNGHGDDAPLPVDCWQPDLHGQHHRPHPATGRLVCQICHPTPDPTPLEAADEHQ
jgi:hypothetical protein